MARRASPQRPGAGSRRTRRRAAATAPRRRPRSARGRRYERAAGRIPSNAARATSAGRVAGAVFGARPLHHGVHQAREQAGGERRLHARPHLPGVDGLAHERGDLRVERPAPVERPSLGLGVAAHPQQQRDVRQVVDEHGDLAADDVAQPRERGAGDRGRLVEDREQPVERPLQRRPQQRLLAGEVVVERRLRDARGAREVLHGRGVVPAGDELAHRHLQQRARAVARPPGPRACRHRPWNVGRRLLRKSSTARAVVLGRRQPGLRRALLRQHGGQVGHRAVAHGPLHLGVGQRGAGGERAGQFQRGGQHLLGRDDRAHQPPALCVLGGEGLVEHQQLGGPGDPDGVGEAGGEPGVGREADADERRGELQPGRRDPQVARHREAEPRADARPVDRGHHGEREVGEPEDDRVVVLGDGVERAGRVGAQRLGVLAEVLPDAERLARSGDHERADAVLARERRDGVEQGGLELDGERVVPRGTVEREHGDGGVLLVALDQHGRVGVIRHPVMLGHRTNDRSSHGRWRVAWPPSRGRAACTARRTGGTPGTGRCGRRRGGAAGFPRPRACPRGSGRRPPGQLPAGRRRACLRGGGGSHQGTGGRCARRRRCATSPADAAQAATAAISSIISCSPDGRRRPARDPGPGGCPRESGCRRRPGAPGRALRPSGGNLAHVRT